MPNMNGPAFYHVIEQQEPQLVSRIIFLTGDTLNLTTQDFLQRAEATVIEKPFTLGKVRKAVEDVLRRSERH